MEKNSRPIICFERTRILLHPKKSVAAQRMGGDHFPLLGLGFLQVAPPHRGTYSAPF